jgi:hypothetical protein
MNQYETPCSNGCGRVIGRKGSKGFCSPCRQAERRAEFLKQEPKACIVEGCERMVKHLGIHCEMHRARLRRNGELGSVESIRRAYGTGGLSSHGYMVRQLNGRRIPEHRRVVAESIGRLLWDFENVHHKNGRRADNRIENLEIWIVPQPQGQRPDDLLAWCLERSGALQEAADWNVSNIA